MKAFSFTLRGLTGCLAILLLGFQTTTLRADIYTYDFSHVISGAPPSGSAPWLRATFEDMSPGTVRLNLLATGLTGSENVVKAYFNLNPSLLANNLTLTHSGSVGSFDLPGINLGYDTFKADGDGFFDIQFIFTNDGTGDASRFTTGESVSYLLTYSDVLYPAVSVSAADFVFQSVMGGGNGVYLAAAHVQRIGIGGEESGWIGVPVPEPSVASLLVGALLLIAHWRRQ